MWKKKAVRDSFGHMLVELGEKNERIVVLSGDLEDSTRAIYFKERFPERFFNLGISEQDMVATAAGLSKEGFIPFACSFAAFLTNRSYDHIRISVCYNNCNVKLVGSHAGITVGPDGATAQCLEDLAVMRILPKMSVICPADAIEVKKATEAMVSHEGPVYMRMPRGESPVITKESAQFNLGLADTLKEGGDVTIIACGVMVPEALSAARTLQNRGIDARVINMHTIKPLDNDIIIKAAIETGAIVTAEEHQINGGLGSAVSEVLVRNNPVSVEMIAIRDTFGESGEPDELLVKYNLKDKDIVDAADKVIKRKIGVKNRRGF